MEPGSNEHPSSDTPWWRRGIVYQVYIRSFADGDGDGTGDIAGLRNRLPYLADLGVDAIWINPWYRSPLADGGYDVADYRVIEPRYGTTEQAELLISEAKEHNIKVIADLVPNHTSDEHIWFKEAVAAAPGDPVRNRYHIRPGKGPDGAEPPNDWTSVFGGPAWTRLADGEWYLHLFAPEQPDVNWENSEVREEMLAVLRFWLDRGIDGFRIDVAHGLVKDMAYPDLGEDTAGILTSSKKPNHPFWDRDGIHEIVREWRSVLESYDGDKMMVAEAWVDPKRLPLYLRSDEYHQSFNFDFLEADWDAAAFGDIILSSSTAAADVGSTSTWVLANHDVMREATRYGLPNGTDWRVWPVDGPADLLEVEQGMRRARAAALLFLGLPGSAYIYQGQELGLPEAWDLPEEVLDDPVWERSNHKQRGRDGCRVPLPWTADGPSLGFGDGEPWLPQPEGWSGLAAAVQAEDPGSSHSLYRNALHLRRQWGSVDEAITMIGDRIGAGPDVLAYERGSGMCCVVNMGTEPVPMPDHSEILLRSDTGTAEGGLVTLAPDTAIWFR